MDRIIASFTAIPDGELMLCPDNGVAYQIDMSQRVPYDEAYFDKYVGYEGSQIARKINDHRIDLVDRYFGKKPVLDVGIGSGEFIRCREAAGGTTFGFDINPAAQEWLVVEGLWWEPSPVFGAFTFWDVLEHVPEPEDYFRHVRPGGFVFTALPIFDDLTRIRESKHYRPNEHLYYWTAPGFVGWMEQYGFRHLETNDGESRSGRENILSFAFVREG